MAEPTTAPTPRRMWANSTLAAAVIWVVLAAAPVPGSTTIGLPFGLYAVIGGFFNWRERRAAGDRTGARRAGWGAGLGCVGFFVAMAFDLLVAGVLLAGLIAAVRAALGVHFR